MNRPRMGLDDLGKAGSMLVPGAEAVIRAYMAYLEGFDDWYRGQVGSRPDRFGGRKTVGGRTAYGTDEGGAPRRVTEFAKKRKQSR